MKNGCGRKLAVGQWFRFCGETDIGQTLQAICVECGGDMILHEGSVDKSVSWDDWSDFQLSTAVAKLASEDGIVDMSGGKVNIRQYQDELCVGWRDFSVNSWADMGPLIDDNGICICKVGDNWMASNLNPSKLGGYQIHTFKYDENPLRAAAIVFLMMNGVKP